ncbi:MAG TPA: HlyD family secretion protein [Candidatus Limnocylindrales bacterium]|nr:HlyD family secretion protein [Candidatus Limnocylindrales bacterium]
MEDQLFHVMDQEVARTESDGKNKRRKGAVTISFTSVLLFFALVIALVAVGTSVYFYLDYLDQWVSTNNAFVEGRIYTVASTVPGRVGIAHAHESMRVSEGDLLLEIDSDLQKLAVKKIEASIESHRLVMEALAAQPGRATELEMAKARQIELELLLEEARLIYQQFQLLAPSEGYVTHTMVEAGEYVLPGQPLMSIVNLDDLWIMANFDEQQIKNINIGQEVDIYIDAFPAESFQGKVESIMPASGAAFALFPPDATAGHWVRVAQRIPVKIVFDEEINRDITLRIGMLARVRITL